MKKLILLALLMSTVLGASAQWVTIPDPNFANKLNQLLPECMDGDQLNTTCPGVTEAAFLELSSSGINDLTGIEHFVSIQYLNCSDNNLSSLPEYLPETLLELYCAANNLNTLPSWLPSNLSILACSSNDLSSLPDLPNTLTVLYCEYNNLDLLPELPFSLTVLHCEFNNFSILPDLPASMTTLTCGSNSLNSLPELPGSLFTLYCSGNNLESLPGLPSSLGELWCHNNDLFGLPDLPTSLASLNCEDNQITCFPTFPENLNSLNISDNPFACLPNYVSAMDAELQAYPLCSTNDLDINPFGCIDGISGTVFNDNNADCQVGEAENGVVNVPMKLLDEEGNLVASTFTLSNTFYKFLSENGAYTVILEAENQPFQPSCVDPGDAQDVLITESEPSAHDVNFGVECLPGFDIGVQSVVNTDWVFPGQVHTLKISAGDLSTWYGLQCAQGVSGTVTVYVNGPVSYVEPAEDALTPTVSGDLQFTYDIADFSNVNFQQDFILLFETDTTAQADDLVCMDIVVDPVDDDINPANNTYTHCYEVVNSYDPNIKQVWPQDVEPGYDGYFNYTIYFQNTGTAPAFNIRVADTLDTNLDLNTFEVTAYSHPCLTYVAGNVATFRFNNIMLPDSTSDFEGSIGYVQYRIKPLADLPVGTVIENTAHIFFDFNDAIVTNTTQNEFVIDTGMDQLKQQLATVFPNPGTGQFNVLFRGVENGLTTHLEVYSLSGQRVLQQQVNENRMTLDLTDYPSGMYLLHVRNQRGSEAVKLLKQ